MSTYVPIRTLLIANRGEVARRIMRTAKTMGITTVAVYSDADAASPHVAEADMAVRLPGVSPSDTYLRSALILDAASRSGADAIHPGYGFLSESGDFARVVTGAGFVWVGPPASAIDAMGSKIGAKELVRAAGVPTLPSVTVEGDRLPDIVDVELLGWPLLVKASAGGGGRGMRIVWGASELPDALAAARREAEAAFGDGTVFLERYLRDPRHIEVQVVGDAYGQIVALFERECSIQRRHQKIIEEAPSPAVTPPLRSRLTEAAVAAARSVGYVNAGTVEFVVDAAGEPAFLEMNTRLQVEHPVTEAICGLDLVRLQLLLAGGAPLPPEVVAAAAAGPRGHAVEARLYAEDPSAGWMPSTGTLHRFEIEGTPFGMPGEPSGGAPWGGGGERREGGRRGPVAVRVDSGVESGSVVSSHYDPMLAKVVAHAPGRDEAVSALAATLASARIHGVTTNRELLVRVLRHPEFLAGATDTGFLDRHGVASLAAPLADVDALRRHALAAALAGQARRRAAAAVQRTIPSGFRNNASSLQHAVYDSEERAVTVGYQLDRHGRQLDEVEIDGSNIDVDAVAVAPDRISLTIGGLTRHYRVDQIGAVAYVDGADGSSVLTEHPRFPEAAGRAHEGSALAPMPGGVVRVEVTEGESVETGQVLVVLEAMKMEHTVQAGSAGTVTRVTVVAGDQVETGQVLVVVEGASVGEAERPPVGATAGSADDGRAGSANQWVEHRAADDRPDGLAEVAEVAEVADGTPSTGTRTAPRDGGQEGATR